MPGAGRMLRECTGSAQGKADARRYLNGVSDELYEGALDTGMRVSLDLGACGAQEVRIPAVVHLIVLWRLLLISHK